MGRSTYVMGWGGPSNRSCVYDGGGGGSKFCNFGAYVLFEQLLSVTMERHFQCTSRRF